MSNEPIDLWELCNELGLDDPDEIDEETLTEYIIECNRREYREAWFVYINGWD